MTIRIIQLGSPRHPEEDLRIGTVRRPPRGVPKADLRRLGVRSVKDLARRGRSRNCSIGGRGRAGRSRERERAAHAYFEQSPVRRARSTSWVLLPSTIESTVIV